MLYEDVSEEFKWLDPLCPFWGLFKDFRACCELSKIKSYGRCVPGQVVFNALSESVAHQLGKDGTGIGIVHRLRDRGDGPVRMATAKIKLVSELDGRRTRRDGKRRLNGCRGGYGQGEERRRNGSVSVRNGYEHWRDPRGCLRLSGRVFGWDSR